MNVLIIAYYYLPDINGGTQRPKNFYYYLNKAGMNTYLLTAGYNAVDYSKDDKHIIRIRDYRKKDSSVILTAAIRLSQVVQRKFGRPVRAEDFWGQNVKRKIARIIDRIRPDVCIATFPPPAVLDIAIYIKKKYPDILLISDFRDGLMYAPMYKEIRNGEAVQNKIFMKRFQALERNILKQSDAVITASEVLTEYFQKTYRKKEIFTISNGFNQEEVIRESPLKLPKNKFIVLHTGGLDCSRTGYFDYFRSFAENGRLKYLDIVLVMIGQYKDYEKRFFSKYHRIIVYPPQPREKVIATQRIADLLLNVTEDNEPGAINGKLYEYLFAGKPILNYGKYNNAEKIVAETDSGRSYSREETDLIDAYIRDLKEGKLKFQHKNLEAYTREAGTKKLIEIIHSCRLGRSSDSWADDSRKGLNDERAADSKNSK